jgi:hypothetical protein
MEAGYIPRHRHDSLWVLQNDAGNLVAIQRETRARTQVWHLVDPPDDLILKE